VAGDPPARRPRLLVLGAGPAQLGLLEAARRRGLYVIAADRDPQAIGFEHADERAVISTDDEPALERLARALDVNGVISPGADWAVGVAARIADRIGLPHAIDTATASLATSKARQRERFSEAGVPQPHVAAPGEQPRLPCVVKPVDQQGQRGLSVVREREALEAAVAAAAEASRGGGYLIEELVEGPEVTVNGVSVEGAFVPLAVTDRLTADPPAHGVALVHAWPASRDADAAVGAARAAAEALGVRNGPTYTQIRLGPHGPRVMELAARLGGGHDAELVEAATGVPLNDLALDFALGQPVSRPADSHLLPSNSQLLAEVVAGACVLFLVAPVGELISVDGIEAASALEGVRWVRVYRRPGWRFGPLLRGADRAGAILAVGASREDALERARRAAQAVRFEVDADTP
jgi:biotin carboxylase